MQVDRKPPGPPKKKPIKLTKFLPDQTENFDKIQQLLWHFLENQTEPI